MAENLKRLQSEVLDARRQLADDRVKVPSVAEFYAGRSVFITGASGFLGKVLVEMLLRTCPDIGKLYIVVRTRKGVTPEDRLADLVGVPLFDRLRAEQPNALDKLVVVPGDITQLQLGMSQEHQALLRKEVSVVFHVAASVRFDDPFQKAVFTNLRSTRELVELARGMPQLKVLVHVSTAYTNINQDPIGERVYTPEQDWREVIRWAEELDHENVKAVDNLGAKVLGFQPNTYSFTKALAEKLIDDVSGELPVVITRPSIVVAAFKDPMPGWTDNLYGLAGFWVGGFKGLMRIVYGEDVVFDSIPVDVATKTTILASWHRGLGHRLRPGSTPGEGADVVNVTIGNHMGIRFSEMSWAVSEAGIGRLVPYPNTLRPPKFCITACKPWFLLMVWYHHYLFGFIVDLLARAAGVKARVLPIYRRVAVALDATKVFTKEFIFELENQKFLQKVMHPKDEEDYDFMDILRVRESLEVFTKAGCESIRGILKYVLKEEDNPEKNWRAIVRLKWVMAVYHSVMALVFGYIFYILYQLRSGRP